MNIYPIWKSTYYTTTEDTVTFRILKWGTEEIYRAKATKYPDEDTLRINLNKPCQNTLDSKINIEVENFSGYTDFVATSNAYAEYELQVMDGHGTWLTVYSFAFYNDWSYDPKAPADSLNEPINGHAAPDQLIPESLINTGDTLEWECFDYEGDGIDYSSMYLTLEIESGGTMEFANLSRWIEYSTDSGQTWTVVNPPSAPYEIGEFHRGQKILLRGEIAANNTYTNTRIGGTATFRAYGNIMSLIYRDNFIGQTGLTVSRAFERAIFPYSNVTRADKLVLPATTLTDYCYCEMFWECQKLRKAPKLPATTLAPWCYDSMFRGCTSLTHAPELPSINLANSCYGSMFWGCTALITPPSLPAMVLNNLCYSFMFRGCTSLTYAPQLPATSLGENCYQEMFYGCTSLTHAPQLPAREVSRHCYSYMFWGCTSLTHAPELPARDLRGGCYAYMFYGCTHLEYVKCLATYIPEYDGEYLANCTINWLSGVAAEGQFIKDRRMNGWTTGVNGIPSGWTVTSV